MLVCYMLNAIMSLWIMCCGQADSSEENKHMNVCLGVHMCLHAL